MTNQKKSEESQPWLPLLLRGVVSNNTQFPYNVVPLAIDMTNALVKVTLSLPPDRTTGDKMDVVDLFILGEDTPKSRHRNTITLHGEDRDYILGVRWVPREGQTYYQVRRDMTVEEVRCQLLFSEKNNFECENCFATEGGAWKFASHFSKLLTTGVF